MTTTWSKVVASTQNLSIRGGRSCQVRSLAPTTTAAPPSSSILSTAGATHHVPQQLQGQRWLSDSGKKRSSNVKKADKGSSKQASGGRSKELDLVLASLDAPIIKEPPLSEEEKARRFEIGRNYVIGSFKRHNEIEHDLACKIQLKKHAIKMMPRDSVLKEEALKVTDDGPPLWRRFAVWTPPIPGFDASKFGATEDKQ